jgi:hypothetical protein
MVSSDMHAVSRALSAAALIMLAGIYITQPGPWRALTPAAFGLTEVGPRVYSDAPAQGRAIMALIERSRNRAEALFGPGGWQPTYVVCTAAPCTRTFGFDAAGLTIGYHLVLIAPSGLNDEVMLHERIHVALHRRMGPIDLVFPRFPNWFDEGLATLWSRPPRVRGRGDPQAAAWVREGATWASWQRLTTERPVDDVYNAAALLVGDLQDRIGRGGILDLIGKVAAGGDFDALYAQALRH